MKKEVLLIPATVMIVSSYLIFRAIVLSAQAQPAPQPPERSYTLNVTGSEANVIGNALSALPYRDVAPILNKLQAQIKEQDAKPAPTASDPPKPK